MAAQKRPMHRAMPRCVTNVATKTKHRIECEGNRKRFASKTAQRPAGRVLIPIQAAAKRLGVSIWTLRSWVYQGQVNFHRFPGGRLMIADSEIERLIRETEVAATTAA